MHPYKRFLALLLVAAMLYACFPVTAGAATFLEQLQAATDGDVLILQQDIPENVTVDKNICIDLNGFDIAGTVTVSEGCTLQFLDSQTDDHTIEDENGYGTIASFSGDVLALDGYLPVTQENGISFHRVSMEITSMTLRPECAGVYYNGSFRGDELVAENIRCFGIALRIGRAPDAAYMKTHSACSRYDGFHGGTEGNTATGTLLRGVMRTENTVAVNDSQSKLRIFGSAYVLTKDGQYLFGEAVSRSLMEQVQAVDAMWNTLTAAQKGAAEVMLSTYSSVTENWYLPNIHYKDIDVPI